MYRAGGDIFLSIEQLEVIAELLRAGSPVKARMALILLDGLADATLFRRLERLYEMSENPWFKHMVPRYPREDRLMARQRFNRRVEMAKGHTEFDRRLGGDVEFISEPDAAILKIGHSYRNRAYHEDRHNESVIVVLTRVLFGAAARMVGRAHAPALFGTIMSPEDRDQLAALGFETTEPMPDLGEAAKVVTERFIAELGVEPTELRNVLAEDLDSRVKALESDLAFLGQSTIDAGTIIEAIELEWYYGADEELLELADQFDPFMQAEENRWQEPTEEQLEMSKAAIVRYRARQAELAGAHRQRVSLSLIEQAAKVAARLRGLDDESRILVAYRAIDEPLSELERHVDDAVERLDREIQLQSDLERGK